MKKKFTYLLSILFILCIGTNIDLLAQQAVLELNSTEGPGEKFARDAVILKPGFESSITLQQCFRAYIDENLTIPITYNPIGETDISTRELDKSLVVGSTTGIFDVLMDGSASYTVPIILPPGTAGMQPNLAITYNSNGREGIMGKGWNLNGTSAIFRSPKTLDPDGFIQEVQFNSNDVFTLDGNRLVSVSNNEFRTAVETFAKITVISSNSIGPIAFKVETKDGLIMEYGNTVDSRCTHSENSEKVIASYINKVIDRNGNYYSYKYTNNPGTGEFRIERIDYTANDNANISFYNSVRFIYEQKPIEQACNTYYLGSIKADNVLLREIRISSEESMSHKYIFNYSTSVLGNNPSFIYLTDIQEFGLNNQAYNKTVFNWGASPQDPNNYNDITCAQSWPSYAESDIDINFTPNPFYGDFDGDGKLETAIISRRCRLSTDPDHYEQAANNCGGTDVLYDYRVGISNSGGLNPYGYSDYFLNGISDQYGAQYMINPSSYSIAGTSDISGDGIDDAVFCSNKLYFDGTKRMLTFFPLISTPDGSYGRKFVSGNKIEIPDVQTNALIQTNLLDINGDGMADLVVRIDGTIKIYYSTQNEPFEEMYEPPINSVSGVLSSTGNTEITFLDYNADGILDFIANFTNSGTTNSYLFVGTSDRGVFNCNGVPLHWTMKNKLYVGDFNNDGNTDIFIPEYNVWHFSKGSGSLFEYQQYALPAHNTQAIGLDAWSNYYVGDFNGDNKTDIAFFSLYNPDNLNTKWGYWGICFNENFSKGQYSYNEYPNGCFIITSNANVFRKLLYAFPVDADGDGATEIKFDRLIHSNSEWKSKADLLNPNNVFCNKITNIANGLNVKTTVNYVVGGFGSSPGTCVYPLSTSFFPMSVVSTVLTSNGIGENTIEKQYGFLAPLTNLRGKGFLGFSVITETAEIASHVSDGVEYPTIAKTTTTYNYGNPYFYPCQTSQKLEYTIRTCEGTPGCFNTYTITENSFNTQFFNYSGGQNYRHFFPFIKQETTTQHFYDEINVTNLGLSYHNQTSNGIAVTTTTTNYYPEENNIDSYGNIDSTNISNGVSSTTTIFENYQTTGSWCPNKPEKITVTSTRQGQSKHVAVTNYSWENLTGLLLSETSPAGGGDPNITVPSTNQNVSKQYTYFPTGSLHQTVVTGNDAGNPTTLTYEYDNKYRFITKQTNALGLVTEASYEPNFGNIVSSKDEIGLITLYSYDNFGRIKEVVAPTGKRVWSSTEWVQNSEAGYNNNRLFFVKTTTEDVSPTYEFFDKLGRAVATRSIGYSNVTFITNTYYDKYGQVAQVRKPGPNSNRVISAVSFDPFGQTVNSGIYLSNELTDPVNLIAPANVAIRSVTFSYDFTQNEFSYLSTDNNPTPRVTRKTFDRSGLLIKATDPLNADVNYSYNSSNQPIEIIAAGATTTLVYDKYGRQYQRIDPDAGTSSYKYNALSQLIEQTDGKGNKYELTYDKLGRVITKKETPNGSTTFNVVNYIYSTEGNGKGQIASMTGGPNNMTTSYKYDIYGRCIQVTESFDGQVFSSAFGYDSHNRVNHITYPGGFAIKQIYDEASNTLALITDESNNKIWELSEVNNAGAIKTTTLGGGNHFTKGFTYTDFMQLESCKFSSDFQSNNWSNEWIYSFDNITGNVLSRQNIALCNGSIVGLSTRDLKEYFTYDENDRLLTIDPTSPLATGMTMEYNSNGSIRTKTDVLGNIQDYSYGSAPMPVHGVNTISPLNETVKPLQNISYTPFNKIDQIIEGDVNLTSDFSQLNFTYGLDDERRKMIELKTVAGSLVSTRTKYYSLNYEKETITADGNTTQREINYIFAPDGLTAIYENKNNTGKYYYVAADGLGSINLIVNNTDGSITADLGYDAWGRRRNPQDWTYTNINPTPITDRGYTGHEMMDAFALINMNGRVYDPFVGQFLSPDPFVSDPSNPQCYNRYSYCLNNPLKYADPSGYFYQEFINQNLYWAKYEMQEYNNYGKYMQTGFMRQYAESFNKIMTFWNWENKYHMFKSYYNYHSFLERCAETVRGVQRRLGHPVAKCEINMEKNGRKYNADGLKLTYESGEVAFWAPSEEIVENYYTGDEGHETWFGWSASSPSHASYMYYFADKSPEYFMDLVGYTFALEGVAELGVRGVWCLSSRMAMNAGKSGARQVAAKSGTIAYRYMTEAELKAIQETGLLRGGRAGETYFTKDVYKSAIKATQRLGLENKPTLRVEFEILNNPILSRNGTKVTSLPGLSGGGSEFMTFDKVNVRLINWQPLR